MSSLKINAILNSITQLCKIVFPIITFSYSAHILGVENIGIFQFSASIVSYFTLIASLGISTYAVREGASYRDDHEAINRFASEIFSINIVSTVISYLLLSVLILYWDKLNGYNVYVIIQSLIILFSTLGANWVNILYEDYLYLTIRYVFFQILSVVLLLLFVKSEKSLLIYTLIKVLASSGGDILNIFYIRKYLNLKLTFKINYKKHLRPVLILFANELTVTIFVNADITVLGLFYKDSEVGIYSTVSSLYNIVKRLVYSYVTVALPRFSYLIASGKIKETENLYKKVKNLLFIVAMPVSVGIIVTGRQLIEILAGPEFSGGYIALCVLSPAIVFVAYSNLHCFCVLIPKKRDKTIFAASFTAAIINIFLNFILIPTYGINAAAFTTLIAELIVFFIYYFTSKPLLDAAISKNNILTTIIGCIGIVMLCILINRFKWIGLFKLFVEILGSVFIYFILLFITKNKYFLNMLKSAVEKLVSKGAF